MSTDCCVATNPIVAPDTARAAELERLGDEIAELAAHLDAATGRLLDLIREFDARGGWGNGFRSCAAWLSWRVGLEPGAAREHVRVARALGSLPRLAQALARGELSYSKVRALTRVATPETEERLLAVGRAGTAEHVELIVRGWRRMDRKAEAQETTRRHRNRALHVYPDGDGMVAIRGRLEPEVGAVVMQALTAAREALYRRGRRKTFPPERRSSTARRRRRPWSSSRPTHWPSSPRRRCTMGSIPARRASATRSSSISTHRSWRMPTRRASPCSRAARVPAGTSQRLACDASRVVMRHDADGRITEVGARTRTIPSALRRALHHRDKGCRFPGCGLPFGQGHHIRHWANGGPTTLSNLAMLCRRHHRAVHEEGFQVERQPDGDLCFRRPDGRPLPEVPATPAVPAAPCEALRARREALDIHARTAMPGWLGERLDVGYAISVLHPLATGS